MTDYERYVLTKKVIERLANGLNPYNDELLPNDSILNDVGVARALFVATEAINKAIDLEKKSM